MHIYAHSCVYIFMLYMYCRPVDIERYIDAAAATAAAATAAVAEGYSVSTTCTYAQCVCMVCMCFYQQSVIYKVWAWYGIYDMPH